MGAGSSKASNFCKLLTEGVEGDDVSVELGSTMVAEDVLAELV